MKKTIIYSIVCLLGITFFACNDEWNEEQYEKYVSFTRSGFVNTYLNYNTEDGVIKYTIPVEVSGTTINDREVLVTIEIDPDTLQAMNIARYYNRQDLFYRILDPKHYTFQTMQATIPAGKDIAYIDVEFNIEDLDMVEKYILPLNITTTSIYEPSPKKWYRRSLMNVIPFNDFSGVYSATGGNITEGSSTDVIVTATREMRVVDNNTVFFYAGLIEEEARNRSLYKVKATFNPPTLRPDSGAIVLVADSAAIGFTYVPNSCYYKTETRMDDLQPYLQIKTTTMFLRYSYRDVTNPNYTVTYNFNGSYVMERRRNTQIPDEDQQEIFD